MFTRQKGSSAMSSGKLARSWWFRCTFISSSTWRFFPKPRPANMRRQGGNQVTSLVTRVEGVVRFTPVGGHGADGILDQIRSAGPLGQTHSGVKQLQCLNQ